MKFIRKNELRHTGVEKLLQKEVGIEALSLLTNGIYPKSEDALYKRQTLIIAESDDENIGSLSNKHYSFLFNRPVFEYDDQLLLVSTYPFYKDGIKYVLTFTTILEHVGNGEVDVAYNDLKLFDSCGNGWVLTLMEENPRWFQLELGVAKILREDNLELSFQNEDPVVFTRDLTESETFQWHGEMSYANKGIEIRDNSYGLAQALETNWLVCELGDFEVVAPTYNVLDLIETYEGLKNPGISERQFSKYAKKYPLIETLLKETQIDIYQSNSSGAVDEGRNIHIDKIDDNVYLTRFYKDSKTMPDRGKLTMAVLINKEGSFPISILGNGIYGHKVPEIMLENAVYRSADFDAMYEVLYDIHGDRIKPVKRLMKSFKVFKDFMLNPWVLEALDSPVKDNVRMLLLTRNTAGKELSSTPVRTYLGDPINDEAFPESHGYTNEQLEKLMSLPGSEVMNYPLFMKLSQLKDKDMDYTTYSRVIGVSPLWDKKVSEIDLRNVPSYDFDSTAEVMGQIFKENVEKHIYGNGMYTTTSTIIELLERMVLWTN